MESLHNGAKWVFRFRIYFALIFFLVFFGIFFYAFVGTVLGGFAVLIYFILFPVFVILIGEIFVYWTYKNWKYEFTPDSLKIEKGVIVKSYKSIPYARIQNVDITRGILARIIGFSTIDIQTAGYSGVYNSRGSVGVSEGHLPAVSVDGAERIREFLMKKISGKKSGL